MPFGSLWLPVVVSTAAVFVLSAVLHMLLKYHKRDYRELSNEDAVADVVRKGGAGPGLYFIPYCVDPAKMKDPAVLKKYEDGPVALLAVMRSGPPKLGKSLGLWVLLCLFISFTAAYVARHTLQPGAPGILVARITGTVAFAAYALGYFQDSIWKGMPWANSWRGIVDGAVYAIVTGLIFAALWPAA